jgi:hypothetical protein
MLKDFQARAVPLFKKMEDGLLQMRANLAQAYGDELDDGNNSFYDCLSTIGISVHADDPAGTERMHEHFYSQSLRAVVEMMRYCKNHDPGQWEAAARRHDELQEGENLDRGEHLGFGALVSLKPMNTHQRRMIFNAYAEHYGVPQEYRLKVRWQVEQIMRMAPEYDDLTIGWVRVYSLVVEAIRSGVGFPPNTFPPKPDDDDGDGPVTIGSEGKIVAGGHRNPKNAPTKSVVA